jgi:hypothetical protein
MIKRHNEEKEEKKLVSFKKFSDLSTSSKKQEDENHEDSVMPFSDKDMPQGPNTRNKKEKTEKFMDTSHLKPKKLTDEKVEEQVEFIGKVAKLPRGVKASKGYNFLENLKVSKSSVWYLLIEKQNNELQMVKYNHKKGVDLSKFVNDLKSYYIKKNSKNPKICALIESIDIDGNDKYSWIKNIPHLELDGKKMLSIITEDLIKLLSK